MRLTPCALQSSHDCRQGLLLPRLPCDAARHLDAASHVLTLTTKPWTCWKHQAHLTARLIPPHLSSARRPCCLVYIQTLVERLPSRPWLSYVPFRYTSRDIRRYYIRRRTQMLPQSKRSLTGAPATWVRRALGSRTERGRGKRARRLYQSLHLSWAL
jgi:hypothetical protein